MIAQVKSSNIKYLLLSLLLISLFIPQDILGEDFDYKDEPEIALINDPLISINKVIFQFNDKVYLWFLKPVTKGYKFIVPELIRVSVKNFFHNLLMPVRFLNCVLQGKALSAEAEFARFIVNITMGIGGFGDPAKKYAKLNPDSEDFGQTLGLYGIGNGFYLVLPFLGPSSLRDSFGYAFDSFLDPTGYAKTLSESSIVYSYRKLNDISFYMEDYESMREAAISPYEAFRDAYIQYRNKKISK
ncbi:MAG: VacJ family lipoprotein [Desulfobacterales bacterium]|nr:VacJ family lipoprotein [Desulfobacterales bacterium]